MNSNGLLFTFGAFASALPLLVGCNSEPIPSVPVTEPKVLCPSTPGVGFANSYLYDVLREQYPGIYLNNYGQLCGLEGVVPVCGPLPEGITSSLLQDIVAENNAKLIGVERLTDIQMNGGYQCLLPERTEDFNNPEAPKS